MTRLAQVGMIADEYDPALPILVATARDEYGCPGPFQRVWCPYSGAAGGTGILKGRDDVPEVGGKRKSRHTGEYM
jgi:hypothetical protein